MRRLQRLSVVALAAGLGSRFGGRKQLAEVGPDGAAIVDVLARRAAAAGFDQAVLVIAPGMDGDMRAHLAARPDPGLPVVLATQERPRGTADAVLAARDAVDGPFVVLNADDLYPAGAFTALHEHLVHGGAEHALVAFQVARTLTSARPVMRARIEVDAEQHLAGIREGAVLSAGDGLQFEVDRTRQPLSDEALVSMNMWGFLPSILETVAELVAAPRDGEAYLPDAVAAQMAAGAKVRVLVSDERCVGITYAEDVEAVRGALL
jgi:bifunctional N-acetylglucosamine-1-phosphate-uridyltransferase/glucosamine-1-phosphate-acetyltransferase GlmU-like protein